MKLTFLLAMEWYDQLECFATGKPFYPSLMFPGNAAASLFVSHLHIIE
jgi:hypothetical protein